MNKPFVLLEEKDNTTSVCKQVARLEIRGNDSIRRVYDVDYCAPTLTTCGGGNREAKILTIRNGDYAVRKLTPKEYWRLQGFEDEYFDRCKNAKISNSQLYKQAGNSITVPVLEAIFRNLFNI
jgi:DNA (cytosine-5)-methyltransferase 1